VMLVLALVYVAPPVVLFFICLLYAASGIVLTISLLRRSRKEKKVDKAI